METTSSSVIDIKDIPVCPECLAMATLQTSRPVTICRTCADKEMQKTEVNSEIKCEFDSRKPEERSVKSLLQAVNCTTQNQTQEAVKDIQGKDKQNIDMIVSTHKDEQKNKGLETRRAQEKAAGNAPDLMQSNNEGVIDNLRKKILPPVVNMPVLMNLGLEEDCSWTLSEQVGKIREALSVATKYRHCSTCFQVKKCVTPELICMDCDITLCNKCSARHKCIPTNSGHIMIPVARPRHNSVLGKDRIPGLLCHTHKGSELGMYCRDCEMLVCRECIVDKHLDCPSIVSALEYANEEREAVQTSRVRYAQVTSFFLEQRRTTEETITALRLKKKCLQDEIRKFFSTLIKACMDVEGALLEELEMSVTDHLDVLSDQSSAWMNLQECMQQLLDVSDVLHFLPTSDFLPLSVASKASLSAALREGEKLAADAPVNMAITLSLDQSLQHDVIKLVQRLGSTALTVNTHNTMVLRKITSTPFSAPDEKNSPQITSMVLLSQASLLAADFNNSCLKLFHKQKTGEQWVLTEVLPLQWHPYVLSQLQRKGPWDMNKSEDISVTTTQDEISNRSDTVLRSKTEGENLPSSSHQECRASPRQFSDCQDDEVHVPGNSFLEMQVVVTSPSSGCFIVNVPLSGKKKMEVVRGISDEKECWGITAMDQNTLAVVTVKSGRSYISMIDMEENTKWRLPLESRLLHSPRQIIASGPSSLLVCDKGKKAVIHLTVDGTVLSKYTGQDKEQDHPEGMCMDKKGYLYITDSAEDSVTVLTKEGTMCSRTSSQQNDLACPCAVCADNSGCLYVANDGGKVLTVYDIIQGGCL